MRILQFSRSKSKIKGAFILFLMLFSLLFSSCNGESYDILPFENKDVRAECTVNEKFDIVIEKRGSSLSLTVLSPKEISGVSFVFSEEGDKIISGDVSIPTSRKELYGIYSMASALTLKNDAMTSAVSRDGVGEISFDKDGLVYTLLFDADGKITDVKITGNSLDYRLAVHSISMSE